MKSAPVVPGASSSPQPLPDPVQEVLQRYWGYDSLRPLQKEAIAAQLTGQDSLVVLPTGGGKSLCYQIPPAVTGRLAVVVSPLISLMKDQVDGLQACGYPAAALHSQQEVETRQKIEADLLRGRYRLLFVSPERLVTSGFRFLLSRCQVRSFAVDEAHCISHWGHDFRPEYRQLVALKTWFPGTQVHAYTATATPRVRQDIVEQLQLRQAQVLVGGFDRPNLTYRVLPRLNRRAQILEVLGRHQGEAVIVYCITRNDTETLAGALREQGYAAAAYHAGLEREQRKKVQEDFAAERIDVVVATVAFGMGIDRSNVRCVIHAAMPKSIEHYQQETGRAGRDGLAAECVLLYSPADTFKWKGILERAADESGGGPEMAGERSDLAAQLNLLSHMSGLCSTLECRHRALSRYFGQAYPDGPCGTCDVCLDEVVSLPESTVVAQKILSCVARVNQRFGAGYVASVLRGADTDLIRQRGHRGLSTFGLMAERPERELINLIYQLLDQGLLRRVGGDRPIIQLSPEGLAVLRGQRKVQLLEPQKRAPERKRKVRDEGWDGVNQELFERLRRLRREIASERGVPAYVVFGDATLRAMAQHLPQDGAALAQIHGVGEKKLVDPGPRFLAAIREYCS